MKLEKKGDQIALALMGNLTGLAWSACEELADKPDELEGERAFDKLIALLDKRFLHEKATELPDAFEEYFFKSNRKPKETLFDFIQRIRLSTRKIKEHGIELPDQVQGWLLLRRAGLSDAQKAMIMTQVASTLSMDTVADCLQKTFGQQSIVSERHAKQVHYQDYEPEYEDDIDEWTEADTYHVDYCYEDWYGGDQCQDDDWWQADHTDHWDEEEQQIPEDDDEDPIQSVDQYDDVYTAYHEARQRMNDLRLSRGFYPIVALAPSGGDMGPGKGKGAKRQTKGKGKKSKGPKGATKGKGKSKKGSYRKGAVRPPQAPGASSSTGPGVANPLTVCLRCGQLGHFARDCPMPPGKKRKPDASIPTMMITDSDHIENLSDLYLATTMDDAKEAVLDGGAQSFVVGRNTLQKYAEYLRVHGVTFTPTFYECDKTFRFGNDDTCRCRTATIIPVNFAGRTGHLYVYVLEGNTPFLFPRPMMEKFGLVVDFGKKRLQWDATSWTDVRQKTAHGHYLLNLVENPQALRTEIRTPVFRHVPEAPDYVLEVGSATGDPAAEKNDVEDDDDSDNDHKELKPGKLRSILYALDSGRKVMDLMLKSTTKPLVRRRRCWEVFVGIGLVSTYLRKYGVEVRQFSLDNYWDLADAQHQRAFLDLMDLEEPDEIWLSPMCGPWSTMQNLNTRTWEDKQILDEKRIWHEKHVLNFAVTVFNKQVKAGRHAHLEHPQFAASWRTEAFRRLHATFYVDFDQCQYGLNVDGYGLNKKPTRVATNKKTMCMLHAKCSGGHVHVPLEGGRRTAAAENYPKELAWKIAAIMAQPDDSTQDLFLQDDEDEFWDMRAPEPVDEDGHPTVEDDEITSCSGLQQRMDNLKWQCGESVFKYVRKLHNGMGHPSSTVLARTLVNANAREEVVWCAKHYECAACQSRRPPPEAAKSGPAPARHFNDRVQMDVLWIRRDGGKVAVLHIVDVATKFGAARVLPAETGPEIVQAFERAWIRPYYAPKRLQMDEGRGFCSQEVLTSLERHGVLVDVAPGEAHTRIGIVERRHAVLRQAVENYLEGEPLEATLDNVREAVRLVSSAINNLSFTKGYTPSQWVLNTNPQDLTSLTADDFNPTTHHDAFENHLRGGEPQKDSCQSCLHACRC